MLDYHKSELLDKLYIRYLTSCGLTKETEEATGKKIYDYMLDVYEKNLRYDIKLIDSEMKHYRVYKEKQLKHLLKLEKIGFNEKTTEEELKLSSKEVKKYHKTRKKFDAENKRFIKIERKFRRWVPLEKKENKPEVKNVLPIQLVSTVEKEEKFEQTAKQVKEEKKSALIENGGIPLEVGTQLKMEEFFNNKESKP